MYTEPGLILESDKLASAITITSAGFIEISEEIYKDSIVTFNFPSPNERIALIPKHLSDENYLFVEVNKEKTLYIGAIIKGSGKLYGEIDVSGYGEIADSLSVKSVGTHFTISYNENTVFKFESALFASGKVRIAGEKDESFYSCEILEPQSIAWNTNSEVGKVEIKIVEIEDTQYMKLLSFDEEKARIFQSISLPKGDHILSFLGKGVGSAFVKKEDDTVLVEVPVYEEELSRVSGVITLADEQVVILSFETESELLIGQEQLEPNLDPTLYIQNDELDKPLSRIGSALKFPAKNLIDKNVGSLYMSITPKSTFRGEQSLVWTDNDSLSIKIVNKNSTMYDPAIRLTVGESYVEMPLLMEEDNTYNILGSWNDESINLFVNEENVEGLGGVIEGTVQEIIFADEESIKEEVVLEEWALFNNKIDFTGDIQEHLPYAVMQSLFHGGISGQNVTWSEIPVAPNDHSPILVQKENGDTLQKVSFFDHDTGEYVCYNQEPFVYDGRSDYVEVAYKNLDEQFRDIAIRTEDGEKIGEPYRIDGKRFYFNLYDIEKPTYKNKTLYATYQVNDTYTVDYNIKAVDGYRINFAKHDGGKRIVYQEGNRYGENMKLATMIDMNPIQNQNHEGFLYITETVNSTDSFRITATPDRLHADGASFSTLIIEPLDYQGNFVSHSNLEIIAERGFVSRQISQDAVEAQKRSGQYLYRYYAPYIQSKKDGEVIEDYIWITDKDNNIGIGYKMLLTPVKESTKEQITNSEKEILTQKSKIIDYLLMYEGIEQYEDETLVTILDLNQDGYVSMDDVLVLESNQRDAELYVILNKMDAWEKLNKEVPQNELTTT